MSSSASARDSRPVEKLQEDCPDGCAGLDATEFYSDFSVPGTSHSLFWKKIYDERRQFHRGEPAQFTAIRPHILRSWKRSRAAKAPYRGLPSVRLGSADLERIIDQNEFFLSTAKPIMEELLDNIHPTSNCIILTDTNGVYLHTLGDDMGAGRRASSPLRGLVGSENIEGTTAMGLCLAEKASTCVLGCEHYNPYFDSWSCAAAPVFDFEGNLVGSLSMTMERDSFNHHTFGLIISAAKAVTEQMRLRHLLRETRTIMDLLGEAVVVLDAADRVRVMNHYARRMFHCAEDVAGKPFADFADVVGEDDLFESEQIVKDSECSLRLADGTALQCVYSSSPLPEGGICLTLRESRRVHKLTNRITRAKAVYNFNDILGESRSMHKALKMAHKASENSMTTLILGQSGVGKELFAQAIHNASDRRDQPFIVINCGTIPRDLVQSELFGYEAGAFTGASRQGAPGKFELADGGTLFLDEIGDMPLVAQVNLLRVLQEGEVTRVGGKRSRQVNVRVIAATHRNLTQAVQNGTFRNDLFYRLNVLVINVPPLNYRRGDVRLLANFFLQKITPTLGKRLDGFSPGAMHCLEAYNWPGNVRELENLVERTAVMADGPLIRRDDLPSEIWMASSGENLGEDLGEPFGKPVGSAVHEPFCGPVCGADLEPAAGLFAPQVETATQPDIQPGGLWESRTEPLEESNHSRERRRIIRALHASSGNVSAAAKEVGVSRVTFYAHLRRHGLSLDSFREE
ncbi:MAG: sigma-54-dependent Fis family transcriptional regulator [Desulfovibrio sp.]|uniref:sigma-54-dependent Fis family transcriptional regulator n=1 Tax=Desulfovibrio sp. 7SRBS1 TaxID=3378064 RepID=UPI003B3DF1C1